MNTPHLVDHNISFMARANTNNLDTQKSGPERENAN